MKDSGLGIRVKKELREKFVAAYREQDRPAAQVLRDFMRAYTAQNVAQDLTIDTKADRKDRDAK